MVHRLRIVFSFAALLLAGCQSPPARLFDGMGAHQRPLGIAREDAQRYFNQGLVFAYAFNHDEAIRSFTQATRIDPNCAMAWWGIALCHGPHINNPVVPPERAKAAWHAVQQAQARLNLASPVERELITALSARYSDPPPKDRKALDQAYAAAMEQVWKNHPQDADVAVLYAESLMDLQPWDLWEKDGKPKHRAAEIVTVLEAALKLDPNHPGANHLYVHAVESSSDPRRALASADRLRTLVPAAGHLVHMPAHIDVRVGNWEQAAISNERAIEADRKYRALVPRQGFYHIYMAHNHHFLSFASMMEGRSAVAERAARAMIAGVPAEYVKKQAALVDGYMPIALEALMRFGKWQELLKEPAPPKNLPITTAFWHFARGVAYAALGDVPAAEQERAQLTAAIERVPKDALMAINSAHKVLAIASQVLDAEIALRRGQIDESISSLRSAVAMEDELLYMEPPEWIQPVRHTLGAVLVKAGRNQEAEAVYREDLLKWPENGWSLYGLATCLKARNSPEAAEVEERFKKAWARADVQIGTSCLCVVKR